MDERLDSLTAVKDTLPTVFGYIGIGLAFGIVARASGISPILVLLMSAITYGGSAQFVAVSMLATHSPLFSIIFSIFLVNSRMILMSTTVARYFNHDSLIKNIIVGSLLTDESFALGMNKRNYTGDRLSFTWLNTANLIAYATWNIASLAGALLGNFISNPEKIGLDFSLVAMFIGLLYLQVISDRSLSRLLQLIVIIVTCVLIYVGLILVPSNLLILLVTLIGCGCGVVIKHAFF